MIQLECLSGPAAGRLLHSFGRLCSAQMSRLHLKGEMMMNRRDFMKLSAASAVTVGAVAGMAPASFAENAGVHTDAEVQIGRAHV